MAHTQSHSYAGSVSESTLAGVTPRDVHLFIKHLLAINATLKNQVAEINRMIAGRQGNTNNAPAEPVGQSPVQASEQSYRSAASNQPQHMPSTLSSGSIYIAPEQSESDLREIYGPALDEWQEVLSSLRPERQPGASADPLLVLSLCNDYLRRQLDRNRQSNDRLLAQLTSLSQQRKEQEDDFNQQLTSFQDEIRAALQERDEARNKSREDQQRLQNEIDNLKWRIDVQRENVQKFEQERTALLQQMNLLKTERENLLVSNSEQTERNTKRKEFLEKENQKLHVSNNEQRERISQLEDELEKLANDRRALKDDFEKAQTDISSLSDALKDVQQSREQAAEEIKRLQQERDSASAKLEQSDLKSTSGEEQTKMIMQLRRRNRELELTLDELRKSKDKLQSMVEDNPSKQAELELRGQLDEVKAMLKVCEDLARTRGETIENLKREQSRSIQNSETFKALHLQFDACKNEMGEQRKKLENEVKELQSKLDEITKERDALRFAALKLRHNPPPAHRTGGLVSDADTGSSAAATLPPSFAQPLRQEIATDAGSPRARAGTRQSAVQTPSNNRLPSSSQPPAYRMSPTMTHSCQYCRAEHPDGDSKFVHEKDCPKKPCDD